MSPARASGYEAWDRFFSLLEEGDPDCTVYVYRVTASGRPIKPFWFKTSADHDVIDVLQARGGGEFRIIIRRGRTIVFSGHLMFSAPSFP
jgi:hypothetical protein